MHPTTPLGFDWWTTSVVLETEGLWRFRVEGWSDPWETWVHNAEIKIPAGIDVALVCTEGIALFEKAAADAEAAGDYQTAALLQGAAKNLDSGQQVEDRLEVVLADDVRAAMRRFGTARDGLAYPGLPDLRRSSQSLVLLVVRVLPALSGCEVGRGEPGMDIRHVRQLTRTAGGCRGDGLRRGLPPAHPPDRQDVSQRAEQYAGSWPERSWLAMGHRCAPRADTTRSIPTSATSTTFDRFVAKARSSGWRSRWTSPCRHRLIIRGSPSIRSGSPSAPTAPSPTRRTRRRSTRTSTRINFDNDRDGIYLPSACASSSSG